MIIAQGQRQTDPRTDRPTERATDKKFYLFAVHVPMSLIIIIIVVVNKSNARERKESANDVNLNSIYIHVGGGREYNN